MYKYLLTLCVLCVFSCDSDDLGPPITAYVEQITLESWPTHKPDGSNWDDETGETNPDIGLFVDYYNELSQGVPNQVSSNNVVYENAAPGSTVVWETQYISFYYQFPYNTQYIVSIHDIDGTDESEPMTGISMANVLIDRFSDGETPNEIVVELEDGAIFKLSIRYEY